MSKNSLFGGPNSISSLIGGIARMVAKDTPEGRILDAQAEVEELRKQETEILLEIGKSAYMQNPAAWPQDSKLRLIRANLESVEQQLNSLLAQQDEAKAAQEAERQAEEAEQAQWRCPSCDYQNAAGMRFCQQCGTKLGKTFCSACGAEMAPGTRFCSECGHKLE